MPGRPALEITSSAFQRRAMIPQVYTCEGENKAPPLSWQGVPIGTESLVLIVDDPDAPDPAAPKYTHVHWVVYDIAPSVGGIPDGSNELPEGARVGINGSKKPGYEGPCPPMGCHRYFFKLYALDVVLGQLNNPDKDRLVKAMEGHVLEAAELVGMYESSTGRDESKAQG